MAKAKFSDGELEQIKSIQERLGCSRKTAIRKFKQSQYDFRELCQSPRGSVKPSKSLIQQRCHGTLSLDYDLLSVRS